MSDTLNGLIKRAREAQLRIIAAWDSKAFNGHSDIDIQAAKRDALDIVYELAEMPLSKIPIIGSKCTDETGFEWEIRAIGLNEIALYNYDFHVDATILVPMDEFTRSYKLNGTHGL